MKLVVLLFKIKQFLSAFTNKFIFDTEKARRKWRYLRWGNKVASIGKNVVFFKGAIINDAYNVKIGNDVGIGNYVVIWGSGGVEIGNDVLIAANSVITSDGHEVNAVKFRESVHVQKVKIGNNVWIGASVCILPGVEIGDNTIIAARSVVTKNIPANVIAAGTPAEVIKERKV